MRRWGKLIALGLGLGWALSVLIYYTSIVGSPVDAYCYWGMDPADPWNGDRCFLYSPPVAQVMMVVQDVVPFELFYTSIRVLEVVTLALITGPAIGPALLIPAVVIEVNAANVNILLVAAVLLGFRYPWTWAFVILTKVTPGVGLLWFAVRREWRHLSIALGVTAALSALSFVVAPWMWAAYLQGLSSEPDESPLKVWMRLPIAAALVVWGARTNRRWTVIAAVYLAMPRWYFLTPVILVGLFPLVRLPRPLPWMRWLNRRRGQATSSTSDGRADNVPTA